MKVTLSQAPEGWQFLDAKGRVVRIDVTEARSFATEGDALAFDGKRLAVA